MKIARSSSDIGSAASAAWWTSTGACWARRCAYSTRSVADMARTRSSRASCPASGGCSAKSSEEFIDAEDTGVVLQVLPVDGGIRPQQIRTIAQLELGDAC